MTSLPAHDRPPISAGIITLDGAVLLVQRRVSEGSLSWQFPAGEVEPGETLEEAAARETAEETGLTVQPIRLLAERIHPKTGRRMAYVACTIVSGRAYFADHDELADLAWVRANELQHYVPYGFAPAVQTYLNAELASD
jgi:8-oxo-dGTP diphosphatase